MQFIAAILFALTSLAALPAAAQQAEVVRACRDDIQKLCAGVKPGEGRILTCLKEKEAEVSERCRTTLATVAGAAADRPYRACQTDVALFCKGIEPGQGRIKECLFKNAAQLSAACRTFQRVIKD